MNGLEAEFVRHVASSDGNQADVLLIEPNGDKHLVRCLVKPSGTDIGGDGEILAYLNHRYGAETVCSVASGAVMGIEDV